MHIFYIPFVNVVASLHKELIQNYVFDFFKLVFQIRNNLKGEFKSLESG